MMTMDPPRESKMRTFLTRCGAVAVVLAAVAVSTVTAYWVFQAIRMTRFDNVLDTAYRFIKGIVGAMADMDPVVSAWAFPLTLGLIVVTGMLIHRHFDR